MMQDLFRRAGTKLHRLLKASRIGSTPRWHGDSQGPTRPHHPLPFYTIRSPQQSHTSPHERSNSDPSLSHGPARRPPPRLRRRRPRQRAGAWPRPPDPDQAGQGRRRGGRRQPGVRVHGVRAHGVDLEGRDGRQHHAGALHRGERRRRGNLGPAVVGRAHVGRPLLLRARQPGHLQRARAVHGQRALPHEGVLRRHRPAPRLVLQLRRGHRHRPAPRLRPAALHRRAVARHRRRALQARRRRRPLPRRWRRRLGVRPCTLYAGLFVCCGW